jgi:glycosyltransferase involved in cell wall biosynthesis
MWSLDWADQLFVGSQMMYDLVPAPFKQKTQIFYPGIENINQYLKVSAKHGSNFAFVGRLDDYKGTDYLPWLFNRIKYSHPNTKLFVAGDGPNINLFKDKIADGIAYLGKTKNSLFMHKIAGIYIAPARYEPSGCAILEAMAQGLVPIVSYHVGYADIVKQIAPELVCYTEEDAVKIANKLLDKKALWKRYSVAGKKIAAKYSYKYMINTFKKSIPKGL